MTDNNNRGRGIIEDSMVAAGFYVNSRSGAFENGKARRGECECKYILKYIIYE
jgi:hypothetical protein